MKWFAAIVFFQIHLINLSSQILINELSSTNNKWISDEDNEYPDWIELYNAYDTSVNLINWSFSDSPLPSKWVFPNVTISSNEHLLVFASGKNKNEVTNNSNLDHWETAIFENDTFSYFVGTHEPPSDWYKLNFDNSSWMKGIGGFGYGDNDDQTLIPDKSISVFYNKQFFVQDTSNISQAILSMDYDDSFVAYLNGIEIARNNIVGSPVAFDDHSITDHEAVIYSGGIPESFKINTSLLKSILNLGKNVLSIQINNSSVTSSDLSGRTWLHFGIKSSNTYFKNNPIWFKNLTDTNKIKYLHTNFKIKFDEIISLYDNNNNLVDRIQSNAQFGQSRARLPDGGNWCYTEIPTPKLSNIGNCFNSYSTGPKVTPASGFFKNNISIEVMCPNCFYTLDGSDPTTNSTPYKGPISISKNTLIKIRNYESGKLPSKIFIGSYFINQNTKLPVISISAEPRNLFIDGTNGPAVYDKAKGFTQSDKTTCHIQYFDSNQTLNFQEHASFTPVGNYSLDFGQKSIQFIFDEDYGAANEEIPNIFGFDKPQLNTLHGFRIRNMDDDWASTRMRDLIANRMGLLTYSGSAAYQNVAVYINGQYWGHYAARELLDKYFMRDNYGANPDSVNLIKTAYSVKPDYFPEEGTTQSFFQMSDFIINSDLSDSSSFSLANEQIDIANWVDYFANEIYNNNQDWYPSIYFNNIRLANSSRPNIKWKFMLWDMGVSQGNGTGVDEDLLTTCLEYPNVSNRYTNMMKSLLKNKAFKNYFINRFADLLNEFWTPVKISEIIEINASEIASEINAQRARWNSLDSLSWRSNVISLKQFHASRPTFQRNHILKYFKLKNQVEITLDVFPKEAGVIKISTIIPDKLPWKGIYFNGNPVEINAIPNPGYSFSHWSSNGIIIDTLSHSLNLDIGSSALFKANFSGSHNILDLEISEINYNSDSSISTGDWFELHNLTNFDVDLSGYTIQDGISTNTYSIPNHTVIKKNDFLVFCSDLSKFKIFHPSLNNVVGPLGFSLNNQSDSIIIKDRLKNQIFSMKYVDSLPWPCTADGYGRTLELKSEKQNPNDPNSWFDGCIEGSPGSAYMVCFDSIITTEINYKSSSVKDCGDWIEIFNNLPNLIDLSNWIIADSRSNEYKLPKNTIIPSHKYLVLVQDMQKFRTFFPSVNNTSGPFNFGLDGNGDIIRFFNANNKLIYSVCFNDSAPFPKEPDGFGNTLELKDYNGNINDGLNWFAGCLGGSPGAKYDPNCGTVLTINHSKSELILSPNPCFDYLQVSCEDSRKFRKINIYNSIGYLMKSIEIQNSTVKNTSIDLSNFPNGSYWIQCMTEDMKILNDHLIIHAK